MNWEPKDHEFEMLKCLDSKQQKRRISYFLEKGEKRRQDVINLFWHEVQFSDRYKQEVDLKTVDEIYQILKKYGSPESVYVMSVYDDVDGVVGPLKTILSDSHDATFVSCIPGKLAYFQYEAPGPSIILRRQ